MLHALAKVCKDHLSRVNTRARPPPGNRYDGGEGVVEGTRPVDRTIKRLQTTNGKPSENALR